MGNDGKVEAGETPIVLIPKEKDLHRDAF